MSDSGSNSDYDDKIIYKCGTCTNCDDDDFQENLICEKCESTMCDYCNVDSLFNGTFCFLCILNGLHKAGFNVKWFSGWKRASGTLS
jgi:hypothetical protein